MPNNFDIPGVLWNTQQTLADAQKLQARNNIGAASLLSQAPEFSTNTVYRQGERVTYDGKVFIFRMSHAAGPWTGSDVIEDSFAQSCGGVSNCGAKTDSDVVNGVLALDINNSIYALTTSLSTLIVEIQIDANKPASPNIVLQVVNSAALTIYVRMRVTNTGGPDILAYLNVAEAAGNELEACASGEGYQVTCVGGCWTCAKFVPCEPPSPPSA